MENPYDDINYCCDLLYKYINDDAVRNEYEFKPIIVDSIKLSDIKKSLSFDYADVLSGASKYIGSYNNKYKFKKKTSDGKYNFELDIGKYDLNKNDNINDLHRCELINMVSMYTLSEIILDNIVIPIMNFDISYESLQTHNADICKNLPDDFKGSKLYINVVEHFIPTSSLNDYVRKNYRNMSLEMWKDLIFQILLIFDKISTKYNSFRHNDLNTLSVKLYETKATIDDTKTINVNDKIFKIPNTGIRVKLSEFEKCYLSESIENNDIKTNHKTSYYDIVTFVYDIYNLLDELKYNNTDVLGFLNNIVPKKYIGLHENEYMEKFAVIPTPSYILSKNNFFSEFIFDNMSSEENSESSPVIPNSEDVKTPTESESDSETPRTIAKNKEKVAKKHKESDDELDEIEVDDELETEKTDETKESDKLSRHKGKKGKKQQLKRQKNDSSSSESSESISESLSSTSELPDKNEMSDSVSTGGGKWKKSTKEKLQKAREKISESVSSTISSVVAEPVNAMDDLGTRLGAFFGQKVQTGPIQIPAGIDPSHLSKVMKVGVQQGVQQQMQIPEMLSPQATLGSAAMGPNMGMPGMQQQPMGSAMMGLPPQMPMPQMPMPQMPMPQMPIPQQGIIAPQMPQVPNISLQGNSPMLPQQSPIGVPLMQQQQLQPVGAMVGGNGKVKKYKLVQKTQKSDFFF